MSPTPRRRLIWELAAIGAVSLVSLAIMTRVITDAMDRSAEERLQQASQGIGAVLGFHLDRLSADLAQAASAIAVTSGPRSRVEGLLGQVIQRHPRLVRTMALVDDQGRLLAGELPRGWTAVGMQPLLARAEAGGGTTWAAGEFHEPVTGVYLMSFVFPVQVGGETAPVLAVTAGVEVAELVRLLSSGPRLELSQTTVLLDRECRNTHFASDEHMVGNGRSLETLFPGPDQEAFRRLVCEGISPRQPGRTSLGGVPVAALVGSVRQEAGGEQWTVLSLRPLRDSRRKAGPLLLAALGGLVLVAGAGAVLLGVRRNREIAPPAFGGTASSRDWVERQRDVTRGNAPLENARDPAVQLKGMRIAAVNPAALHALGLGSVVMAVDRDFLTFVAPEERDRVEGFLKGLQSGEKVPVGFQTKLVTTAGERRVAAMHVDLVDADGNVELLTWRDITSGERAEALLRSVSQWVPAALVLLDPRGSVAWANEPFSMQTGFRVEHFHGSSMLPLVLKEDQRRAVLLFHRARRGKRQEGLLRIQLRSGSVDLAVARVVPVFVAGALFGVLVVAHRFSGSHFSRAAGEEVGGVVTQDLLLNSLSHQLNNDLQALFATVANLSADGVLAVEGTIKLESLLGQAAAKARQLLIATRSGTGVLAPVRLSQLVERWCRETSRQVPAGVRLLAKLAEEEDRVLADSVQVEFFLDVALEAAVAILRPGGGVVEVGVDLSPDGPAVRLSVTDTGGVTDHGTQPGGGSSLMPSRRTARAAAEMIARRHTGSAGSKERAGIGFRIWLDLPIWTGSGLADLPLRIPRGRGAILVADDEETIRRALVDALREQGRIVVEAANGAEAVELVLANPDQFSLVVLDLVMPVMDGRAALRRLREVLPDLPVLVCTGYDPAVDPELALVESLIKPFSVQEFLDRVEAMLPETPDSEPESGATMEP